MATVLIVEDDLFLAECFTRWLQSASHNVQHATSAQDAIDAIDTTVPDVILLDMLLPGANGIQLLHTLKSYTDLAHIPVVVCSNALPQPAPEMDGYGVVAVLDKSTLTRSELQEAVNAALA